MTFSDPVESLNQTSAELRNWDMRKREGLQELMIRAADELDDIQHGSGDTNMELNLLRALVEDWATRLDQSTQMRIGQMDSDSRAAEKMMATQREVLDVIRLMREVVK